MAVKATTNQPDEVGTSGGKPDQNPDTLSNPPPSTSQDGEIKEPHLHPIPDPESAMVSDCKLHMILASLCFGLAVDPSSSYSY
jgi:hypothetical protein